MRQVTLKKVTHDGANRDGVLVRAEQPWSVAEFARLYDAFIFEDDLPFYLDLAKAQGQRVLEVACGSGRVVVPLARAGFDVVGVDVSRSMLALAREKLDAEGLAGRAELLEADMRRFDLEPPWRDFDLAIGERYRQERLRAEQLRARGASADAKELRN